MKSSKKTLFSNLNALAFVLFSLVIYAHELKAQVSSSETYADLAPTFAQRCIVCHSGEAAPLGLRLDSFESILKGSNKGSIVKAGAPEASELIRRLKGISQPRMPMTGPPYLSDNEISKFERWIAGGLPIGNVSQSTNPDQAKPILPMAGEQVTYTHVAPIFAMRCAKCHAEQGLMGTAPEGYKLTSYESTLSTNDRVRVVPGKPALSELIRRIRGHALPRMPFDGPPYLSENEIQLIENWVSQGARNAEGKVAPSPVGATVRLHGKLSAKWQLDNAILNVDGQTRIDKSPKVGDYVEVRGYLDDALNVRVERLRRR